MYIVNREFSIDWGDCDPAGIVFYPRYFCMFDVSTAFIFNSALKISKYELLNKFNIIGFPMVDNGARFHYPSRFGDIVNIETKIDRFGRSSFDVSHKLWRDGVLAIEAYEKRVWAARDEENPEKIRGVPIPEIVIDALSIKNKDVRNEV